MRAGIGDNYLGHVPELTHWGRSSSRNESLGMYRPFLLYNLLLRAHAQYVYAADVNGEPVTQAVQHCQNDSDLHLWQWHYI